MFEMEVIVPVILWLFHVVASTPKAREVDIKFSVGCDSSTSSTSEMAYLAPALCQSKCQPRETLVRVWHEFPDEIHHTILPCSVPVQRCGGFCGNEATVCVPVKNYTVLLQVQRFPKEFIELPFVQHSGCSCRSRKSLTGPFV